MRGPESKESERPRFRKRGLSKIPVVKGSSSGSLRGSRKGIRRSKVLEKILDSRCVGFRSWGVSSAIRWHVS